jgi:hypothetical protein
VYASAMTFPHPSASKSASGFMLFTRCLPRGSNGLAVMSATLGSFYWLGFETSDLSSDKKRLAWLGAQQFCSMTCGVNNCSTNLSLNKGQMQPGRALLWEDCS